MSDRKYKQQGYRLRDEARESAPKGSTGAPPAAERSERPRGRGLGAPTAEVFRCARCGEPASVGEAMASTARCAACGNDLHTCTNCVAFDSSARFECRREIAVRVSPKDRANRCELFAPRMRQEFAQERRATPDDPRSAFDALFKR